MNKKNYFLEAFSEHRKMTADIEQDISLQQCLEKASHALLETYSKNGKLLVCGNGGSACDAQHIVGELVSRFFIERKGLYAEALSANIASLTAIGNDYSYEKIFQRQVEANGRSGDVLMGLSTSGNSKNVILAMEEARKKGITTIGITGANKEAQIVTVSDHCIHIPSLSTPRIQEGTMLVAHAICEFVEAKLFSK